MFLGNLPPDFLRISASSQQQQEAADQQTALALQQQMVGTPYAQNPTGKLSITVDQVICDYIYNLWIPAFFYSVSSYGL